MKLRKSSFENLILIAGAGFFVWLLLLPKPSPAWVYSDTVKYGSATLKGQTPFSDFAAMVVGFRALSDRTDPYPNLGEAFKGLGIDWPVNHGSNHPPTSYLLAAPVAFLPWPFASAAWAWAMVCLMVLSYRLYGLSWKIALGLTPFTLLWPPASASLGQVTIVWMFGVALAYYFRKGRPFWSGAGVALASLSKYMPAVMMVIFLAGRKWKAVFGFLAVWIGSLALVTVMNPAAVPRYVEENQTTTFAIIERPDNSAPLVVGYRYGGWAAVALILLFFALIVFIYRRDFYEWEASPSTRVWMLTAYLSVAWLPIFWVYSLTPLLPVLVYLIFQRKIVTTFLCLLGLILPSVYISGGEATVLALAGVSLLTGLAFICEALPFKMFQRRWWPEPLAAGRAGRGLSF